MGRLLIAGTAAATAAAVLALGGVFASAPSEAGAEGLVVGAARAELQKGFSAGDTQAEIAGLQAELRLYPRNAKALDTLGLAYQQRARETADPTYYGKAEGILVVALRLDRRDLFVSVGLG